MDSLPTVGSVLVAAIHGVCDRQASVSPSPPS